jgi:hypothetical protein
MIVHSCHRHGDRFSTRATKFEMIDFDGRAGDARTPANHQLLRFEFCSFGRFSSSIENKSTKTENTMMIRRE